LLRIAGGALVISSLTMATAAGAATISVKISQHRADHRADGQDFGQGTPTTARASPLPGFADECTSAVAGKLTVADEKHCDVALAKGLKVARTAPSPLPSSATGTVGDGTCSNTAPWCHRYRQCQRTRHRHQITFK